MEAGALTCLKLETGVPLEKTDNRFREGKMTALRHARAKEKRERSRRRARLQATRMETKLGPAGRELRVGHSLIEAIFTFPREPFGPNK